MFKRVEKHRQKKEDAENLELDGRWQEILGFHDTDSEESTSDSSDEDVDVDVDDEENDGGDHSEDDDDDEEGEYQDMTISQALTNPLCVASVLQPEVKAHVRRFKHFNRLAADAKPTDSARKLFRSYTEKDSNGDLIKATSKRAEKKKVYQERQKERRSKLKMKRAKKAEQVILPASGPTEAKPLTSKEEKRSSKSRPNDVFAKTDAEKTSPVKKKRKINESREPAAASETHPSPKRQKTMGGAKQKESDKESDEKKTVTGIVRSTADRAIKARLKAKSASKVRPSKHSKSSNS